MRDTPSRRPRTLTARARAFASHARATTSMERSERRGDRLRVVTMYTGAGAVDYGYERTTRRMKCANERAGGEKDDETTDDARTAARARE